MENPSKLCQHARPVAWTDTKGVKGSSAVVAVLSKLVCGSQKAWYACKCLLLSMTYNKLHLLAHRPLKPRRLQSPIKSEQRWTTPRPSNEPSINLQQQPPNHHSRRSSFTIFASFAANASASALSALSPHSWHKPPIWKALISVEEHTFFTGLYCSSYVVIAWVQYSKVRKLLWEQRRW